MNNRGWFGQKLSVSYVSDKSASKTTVLSKQTSNTTSSTPNKNAFIESFFSIYETQFLQVRYFETLKDAYEQTEEFIKFYNTERLHGSLKHKTPAEFNDLFNKGEIKNMVVNC